MKQLTFSFFICAFLLTGCKLFTPQNIADDRLHIVNQSHKPIYAYFCTNYPATTIIDNPTENTSFPIKQGNSEFFPNCVILNKTGSWEHFFKEKSEDFRLHVFIFDANIMENVSWKDIKKEYLILKRFDLSEKELKDTKWDVLYQGK